ncbi:MAG: fumarate reductase subunit A [Methanomicrobiales archaeon]|nr:fumarate reductase subunit A [Methanomicrobiales archaeon]
MRGDEGLKSHVLIVGSGGAGVRAALEAAKYGDVIITSKSIPGKGGCTPMAEGGYNAVLRSQDSCVLHSEDTFRGGAYLNDPALVEVLVRESPDRLNDLVRWGAVFDFTEEDTVAQRSFGGQRFPRTCYAGDRTGHEVMMTLLEQLRTSDVQVLSEVTVISLLAEENRVTGAYALTRDGNPVTIRADSTVLATGGGSQIYDISTNSATGTGDGYALGYRAGAELIDMEMVQFHPTGAVYPYDARGRLITEAVRGEGGILTNARGERFMERYDPERMELSTRDVVARAIATEVLEGRGTARGGVYLDVTHLPARQIEEKLPVMLEQFLRFGVDIRSEPMEVAPTAHHFMGGLRITPDCTTTVPGLFACGEAAGGLHGANRLGGNALAETQVFGKRAGESAGKSRKRTDSLPRKAIAVQEERLSAYRSGIENPVKIRRDLRLAMWEGAGIFRTAPELETTLEKVDALAARPLKAYAVSTLAECCTVENMCLVASLVVRSALLRTESRGAHVRTDIKQPWDAATSPFGHTYMSVKRAGIERSGCADAAD